MENRSKEMAEHFIKIKRYDSALEEVNKLLMDNPKYGYYLYLRGYCLYNMDKSKEAIGAFEQSIAEGYSEFYCFYMLAKAYQDLNNIVRADDYYILALNINPNDAEVLASYGYMLLKNSKKKKGSELIEKALQLEPNNKIVLHYAFYYYYEKGNAREQQKIIEKYVQYSTNDLSKYIKIAYYEHSRGNYREAMENFKQAFLLNPQDKSVLLMITNLEIMLHPINGPYRYIIRLRKNKAAYAIVILLLLVSRLILLLFIYTLVNKLALDIIKRRRNL